MLSDPEQLPEHIAQIERFSNARILCVGDIMLDRFIYGEVTRISPEAPIPVMKRQHEQSMLGGAGNVVRNIVSLGASCCFISVIGEDATGRTLTQLVGEQERLEPYLMSEKNRRSTEKSRFVCGNQQLLRCDDEEVKPISKVSEDKLLKLVEQSLPDYPLLVLSDYAKGVLSDRVIRGCIELAKQAGVPVYIDPKRPQIEVYRGATLLSPNLLELKQTSSRAELQRDDDIAAIAKAQCNQYDIEQLLVTRGKDGLSLIGKSAEIVHVEAHEREVFDVSGAGDTVIATLAVAVASGVALPIAAELANLAASIVVGRLGTATIYRTDLKAALHQLDTTTSHRKIASIDMASAMVDSWRQEGQTIGFTNGCFDLLHVGHLQSLQDAKQHCDKLIVATNSDESVRRLKGDSRPINREMDRAALLAGLSCVDLVVIFRDDTPVSLIERFKPDVLMKGSDYKKEDVVGHDIVEAYGGRIELLPLKDGYSSSEMIQKAKVAS